MTGELHSCVHLDEAEEAIDDPFVAQALMNEASITGMVVRQEYGCVQQEGEGCTCNKEKKGLSHGWSEERMLPSQLSEMRSHWWSQRCSSCWCWFSGLSPR